jgi:ABC-2 type transport system permease protein
MTATTYDAVRPVSQRHSRYALSFGGAVASEWVKLRSMRFTWWCVALQLVMGTAAAAFTARGFTYLVDQGSSEVVEGMVVLIANQGVMFCGVVIFLVLGALAVTSEYAGGSIRSTLAADPRRGMVLGSKTLVVGLAATVLAVVSEILGVAAAAAVAVPGGIGFEMGADGWKMAGGAVLFSVVVALMGAGLAFCLRSSAGVIAVGLGLLFAAPVLLQFASGIKWVVAAGSLLPSEAGSMVYAGPLVVTPEDSLLGGYWGGVACLVAWAVAAALGGYAVLKKRDA